MTAATRALALEEGAGSVVVMTGCADAAVHRSRVEGRQRLIPNWYELDWDHVETARKAWVPPQDVDLVQGTVAWETLINSLAGGGTVQNAVNSANTAIANLYPSLRYPVGQTLPQVVFTVIGNQNVCFRKCPQQ